LIKIAEPGDWAKTIKKDQVSISHGFDFIVTDRGDEHFISQVNDLEFGEVINLHTYRKADTDEFKTVPYNLNGQLYTFDNNIYLVGLKSGRVTIAKAPGGTSNFEVVYQHDHGPIFDKGVSYVAKGKVYYFLKQAEGTGDTRTLYLQVFDLK